MDLELGSHEHEIIDAARRMLLKERAVERFAASKPSEPRGDVAIWDVASELGWFALGISEEAGGAGLGVVENVLLFRELGRALAPVTFLGTAVAALTLERSRERDDLLEMVLSGSSVVAVAARAGDREVVFGGTGSDLVLLQDHSSTTLRMPHPEVESRPCIDESMSMEVLHGQREVSASCAEPMVVQQSKLLCAAMLVGNAEATVEMSVNYAKAREQFGRPIGSFQAVAHRCVDMAVRSELAFTQLLYASVALTEGHPSAVADVAAAKVLASRAALQNARANIHNHGAIGFTMELAAHRYLKRAHVLSFLCGTDKDSIRQIVEDLATSI
jgi:alkylation response protein AidB-like acyl-CoA dehydrogenase